MEIWEKYFHKASFIPASATFTAVYNAITPGRYDFTLTPACANVQILALLPGTIYWIRKLSIGGNIPQEDFLGSIVMTPAPISLTVRRIEKNESVYRFPLIIDKYNFGACEAWIDNDIVNEVLALTLTGQCIQLPSMVGVVNLSLSISFDIYSFNDSSFAAEFKHALHRDKNGIRP